MFSKAMVSLTVTPARLFNHRAVTLPYLYSCMSLLVVDNIYSAQSFLCDRILRFLISKHTNTVIPFAMKKKEQRHLVKAKKKLLMW